MVQIIPSAAARILGTIVRQRGVRFIADYGTMGVNYLLGNGAVS